MTKKKSIFSKLFVALVALTLISCCFLGSTFARYTSSGTGSASVDVAKWAISETTMSGTSPLTFATLSPSADDYNGRTARTNSTAKVLIATIKNNGDVNAKVTIEAAKLTYDGYASLSADQGITDANYTQDRVAPSQAQFDAIFSIALTYGTSGDSAQDNTTVSGEIELQTNGTLYVYAVITWTSLDVDYNEGCADAIDTYFGENVETLTSALTWTAVQSSELPNA